MELRRAVPADLDAVASWFASSEEVYLFAGDSARWPLSAEGLAADDAATDLRPAGASFVADVDGAVAGHVTLRGLGAERVHLTRIALAPAVRGRGLATPLVQAAVAVAEAAGSTRQTMLVVPGNEPALRAYARAGFVDEGVDPEHPEYVFLARLRQ